MYTNMLTHVYVNVLSQYPLTHSFGWLPSVLIGLNWKLLLIIVKVCNQAVWCSFFSIVLNITNHGAFLMCCVLLLSAWSGKYIYIYIHMVAFRKKEFPKN